MSLIEPTDVQTIDGLLSDEWTSVDGIAFSEVLPGGRDFTNTIWTWRDPSASLVPLYLQTENEPGHAGATLVGFIERFTLDSSGTVGASGRFYDTEPGRLARDLLLGGRMFGVSVDGTEDVQAEMICDEEEDGICIDGRIVFSAYEIGGLTMTPFQGFDRAAIRLTQTGVVASGPAPELNLTVPLPPRWYDELLLPGLEARVAAVAPEVPPRSWFDNPNFDGPTPLTITDEGQIYGHAALWGTCHLGLPGCETPFHDADYELFHLGYVKTDDGDLPVGKITMGKGHASTARGIGMAEALSHYDSTCTQAAWIRAGEDSFGIWFSGTLCPDLDDDDVRRLQAAPLSADWRPVAGQHRLVHLHAVNTPGYPVPRVAAGYDNGALTAAVITTRPEDFDCGCAGHSTTAAFDQDVRLARLEATIEALGLNEQAAAALTTSIGL